MVRRSRVSSLRQITRQRGRQTDGRKGTYLSTYFGRQVVFESLFLSHCVHWNPGRSGSFDLSFFACLTVGSFYFHTATSRECFRLLCRMSVAAVVSIACKFVSLHRVSQSWLFSICISFVIPLLSLLFSPVFDGSLPSLLNILLSSLLTLLRQITKLKHTIT